MENSVFGTARLHATKVEQKGEFFSTLCVTAVESNMLTHRYIIRTSHRTRDSDPNHSQKHVQLALPSTAGKDLCLMFVKCIESEGIDYEYMQNVLALEKDMK